ncbi:photosystem ii d1 [Leptolyngbya sp. Heron Island J]|nr:photosystem ii d1 [Leptolyngbya sp. Heron Island J]
MHRKGCHSRLYLHLWLAVFPTVWIWFATLGVSAMAFNLNGFNFNHSVLDALGCPVLTYSDQGGITTWIFCPVS